MPDQRSPTCWIAIRVACFAFVNDIDLLHANDAPGVTTADLIDKAQQMLSTWHGLIRATVGDLAPEKKLLVLG